MIRDVKALLFLVVVVVVITLLVIEQIIEPNFNAYAHYFTPDQSAEFLSLIHQINVEISLINNTFPLEIDSSYYHAKNAAELINKTYHLANAVSPEDFRIVYEEEQLNNNNSTVQALVIANIADEILREYGDAYDIDFDLTDMSNMLITNSISAHGEERYSNNLENSDDNDELVLVNIWNYQSAQALSGKAVEVFERNLRPLTQADNNSSNSDLAYTTKVENSLVELNNLLNSKKTLPENLMDIVHTQIHPSLQLAYNLEPRE
jgi:hypothetical protein